MAETKHPEPEPVVVRTLAEVRERYSSTTTAGAVIPAAPCPGGAVNTSTTYRVDLPWTQPPLTLNQRYHWAKKARINAKVRSDVGWLLKAARIPAAGHVTVCMFYAPGDLVERDEDNLTLTTKPIFDAVADAGIVPKDTPQFMAKLMPVIVPPPEPGPRCWLTVEITPQVGSES